MTLDDREWLEADGLGGFASGTVSGQRTRRYHALLLSAATQPTGRFVLVNGFEAFVTTGNDSYALSTQHYGPNVIHPDGHRRVESFSSDPWPTWKYRLDDDCCIQFELFVPHGSASTVLRWTLIESPRRVMTLSLRLLMSGRDYHALHHENGAFPFEPQRDGERLKWEMYAGVPKVTAYTNSGYEQSPQWYRNFNYAAEAERGLEATEDLASPGVLRFDLSHGPALCVLTTDGQFAIQPGEDVEQLVERLAQEELLRRSRVSRLERSADAYLVRRGTGQTIIAGYPWFTDWGRDTFIALRGLCLATRRLEVASLILRDWASVVSEGMLPNRFPDQGDQPEYNSVDASLWYIVAVHEYQQAMERAQRPMDSTELQILQTAVEAILSGYAAGTRYGIRMDADCLLSAGEPGVQLTWMDVKLGDWVVTPRIGKPVEVQALWINALWIGSRYSQGWHTVYEQARVSFVRRFWNQAAGCLYDVVDADHRAGENDPALRPNQLFAVGGLPVCVLDRAHATQVVDLVEKQLLTPLGLRTLDPNSPEYRPHYTGGPWERDSAYHQGTAWPWLMGAFVEAWVRVRGETDAAKNDARQRFLAPLMEHLDHAGLGHVSEIVDGEPPHTSRGCPFQAWSVGELLRLDRVVLADSKSQQTDRIRIEEGATHTRTSGAHRSAARSNESLRV